MGRELLINRAMLRNVPRELPPRGRKGSEHSGEFSSSKFPMKNRLAGRLIPGLIAPTITPTPSPSG
ncbi:hypothetical protein K0M31_005550, partial [Melipona bicolor]